MRTPYFLYVLLAVSGLAQADLNEARALLQQDRASEALTLTEKALRAGADDLQARFLQAQLLARLGRDKEAIAGYEALTRDYPQQPEPYNNLAVLYAAQGKHNKARDTLLKAINTHPSYATAFDNLGNIYGRMAVSAYNKALELDKQQSPAPISLAAINKIDNTLARQPSTKTLIASRSPVAVEKAATTKKKSPAGRQQPEKIASSSVSPVVEKPSNNKDDIKLLMDTINGWSSAWSAQNVDSYLSYYSPNFRPSNGMSRPLWELQRQQRLRSPGFIRIHIRKPEVKILGSSTAKLLFEQRYESDRFKDKGKKVLLMEKVGGKWKIMREYNA